MEDFFYAYCDRKGGESAIYVKSLTFDKPNKLNTCRYFNFEESDHKMESHPQVNHYGNFKSLRENPNGGYR